MSYSDPAPFAYLASTSESMEEAVKALQDHPEGKEAFAKWMKEMDFTERFGVRYKDLRENLPETMVLSEDTFYVNEEGVLCVESGYSMFLWENGKWVDEDTYFDNHQ